MERTRENILAFRHLIESAAALQDDANALESVWMFPEWDGNGVQYAAGDRVRYNGILYRVLNAHTSQTEWTPKDAPSLFARMLIPDETQIYPWEQPDSTNPYNVGDKVTYAGKTWVSTAANNVWAPGVYGWMEVAE